MSTQSQLKTISITILLTSIFFISSQSIYNSCLNSQSNHAINTQTPTKKQKQKKKISETIIKESLARNYAYFGEEGMAKIRNSFVIIVGLGGVGSATATMLVRSGVGKIRIIDFDQVSLSSLNVSFPLTLSRSP